MLVMITAAGYVRVGWWGMESHCTASPPGQPDHGGGVATSWSWKPLGFQCNYEDGFVETSLWF